MINKAQSLYIHIPFCLKICDYCDFTKLQYFTNFASTYLTALQKELEIYQPFDVKTIYVGGGTPTCLENDLFVRLLEIIKPYANKVKEYTFEANPESLSIAKIRLLRKYGINRLSLGVQTSNDQILKYINRDHTFADVKRCVNDLKNEGINNINVDLILGLPHASEKVLKQDLENILSLDIKHISCYALTLHPHTVLYNYGYRGVDDDQMREYYDIIEKILSEHGFIHYEISNYCLPSFQSQHNLTYWRNQHYFGVGLGASGYLDDVRYKNTANLTKYINQQFISEKERLTRKDELIYQIMLNLRTNEGLSLNKLKEDYDYDLYNDKKDEIDELIKQKLLIIEGNVLKPTYQAMMILDVVLLKLI